MDDAIRDNRRLWDAWTKIHLDSAFYDVPSFRTGERGVRLKDYEIDEVGDVRGRTLLHLQCHFGMDTLSWARLGAIVTGADFSETAITAARELAVELEIPATFIASAIYDLPGALDGQFDIVYTSRGVLGWLPDMGPWARVVAHFVKPGGFFYINEVHPVAQVFDDREGVAPGELRLHYPYWSHREPISNEVKGSYADRTAPTQGLVEHGWDHSMGEIVTALIDAGLQIDFLHEFDFNTWAVPFLREGADGRFRLPTNTAGQLPLSFSLKATRPRPR
jgi:SAM-dependent methyltransferase